jgi:hypothetical protein
MLEEPVVTPKVGLDRDWMNRLLELNADDVLRPDPS